MCEPPGRVAYRASLLKIIIERAYNLQPPQIVGPDWLDSERFDIDAQLPAGVSSLDIPLLLCKLLADRFKLSAHTVIKEVSAYGLVVDKNGSKLNLAQDSDVRTPMREDRTGRHLREKMPMANLAHFLSLQLGSPVADETGLRGLFMVSLDFAPEYPLRAAETSGVEVAPHLSLAIQQQLGLKLEPRKSSLETLVVDHIEKVPTAN